MSFESLSYRFSFSFADFPERWLPLICLYDPDLPLFPIYYFHVLSDENSRPNETQRAYGYVEKLNLSSNGHAEVTIVTNKNLTVSRNKELQEKVIHEIKERFGLVNPVNHADINNTFQNELSYANDVLSEMWHRVVSNAYGNLLPFGRMWDGTLGLTRFVASWNSPGGRKGELIQTHYFLSKFGERIQSSGDLPQVDFYLVPTIEELTDSGNPLSIFPKFSKLARISNLFQGSYCTLINVDGIMFSKFTNPSGGKFNTEKILAILLGANIPIDLRQLAIECFNSFDKGPQRTVIYLLMLDDLRQRRVDPATLTPSQCGSIYDGLGGTYQTPKAIQIYAQQSFGNVHAMPIDTWIETFFRWPLKVWPQQRTSSKYLSIFSNSQLLGKTERLLWVAAQARKVHSSACNDIIWCTKYSSSRSPRGANPLACNICSEAIRKCCPAYNTIKNIPVHFNSESSADAFNIITSNRDNSPNQTFVSCTGKSIYSEILDDFSPADDSNGFAPFPASVHDGSTLTVDQFVNIY